jgi:alkanesulfonate monooxygenase SsuD/methylene tetrahydromethanopterin reductase-like flavin-dependent oxidoreductase (luciferase family)
MELGVHLPLMDVGLRRHRDPAGRPSAHADLVAVAEAARDFGFSAVAANDHLVFPAPWLDGPTALAAVLAHTGDLDLMTSVVLPVVRGPTATAKTLAALDLLSGGRLVVGAGPGSSEQDYAQAAVPFGERWPRFDESVQALRALLREGAAPFTGRFYATDGLDLRPRPPRPDGPPLWVGSWGSDAGLARVARLGDGWLASAYNTTPDAFAAGLRTLGDRLPAYGTDPATFPNALATVWFHLSDDRAEADGVLARLAAVAGRPEEVLRERLPFGPAPRMVELLAAYREAGVQRALLWPLVDEVSQLARFCDEVRPHLG